MARFRLGLAGAIILSFLTVWLGQAPSPWAGVPAAVLAMDETGVEAGRRAAETLVSTISAADDQNDDLSATRRASALRAPHRSWWRIGPPGPSAALWRTRARSTGPPAIFLS